MFSDLSDKHSRQLDLFSEKTDAQLQRIEVKMQLIEAINGKFGCSTLRIAAEGTAKPWEMLQTMKSPNLYHEVGRVAVGEGLVQCLFFIL